MDVRLMHVFWLNVLRDGGYIKRSWVGYLLREIESISG